eukprot:gene5990-7344_t
MSYYGKKQTYKTQTSPNQTKLVVTPLMSKEAALKLKKSEHKPLKPNAKTLTAAVIASEEAAVVFDNLTSTRNTMAKTTKTNFTSSS